MLESGWQSARPAAPAPAWAPRVRRLAVLRLTLRDFRCYPQLRVEAPAEPVVLVGPNGAGKTNLLEALSLLAPGRGLRGARPAEIARWRTADGAGGGGWAVAARIEGPKGTVEIGTGLEPKAGGGEKRTVRIDGEPKPGQAALAEHVNAIWLTPEMDRLFQDGPQARRRFIDRLAFGFDAGHARRVAAYEHALRERLRLLVEPAPDPQWLAALEETMAATGVAVAAARMQTAARLSQASAAACDAFPKVCVGVAGGVEDWLGAGPALAAEERLRAALQAARARDAAAGRTAVGPHASEIAVAAGGDGRPATRCSTGEQKALLVAILLAHVRALVAEREAMPLLLLDEVASHLDERRRRALFAAVLDLGVQAWLTGTDRAVFAPLAGSARFFAVAEAKLRPLAR